jgi:hypothetical protein
MGFLNEQSLRIVWSASRYCQAPLYFPGIITSDLNSTNLYLTQSGPLRRVVIAAKLNATAHVGWPKLQIMRMNMHHDTYDTIASTTDTIEPRPTEYLNVYEYELISVTVQIYDVLVISWHGDISQPAQIRFSLAYYINNNGIRVPMVSIVVGDYDSEIGQLTSNALRCEEVTTASTVTMTMESIGTTQASTKESDSKIQISTTNETIIISGVVLFSLVLLSILLFVFTFVVKRRRKSASMNVTDPIEMSTQPQMIHNAPSKSIMDSNQVYTTREEVKHVDCIEMDSNQAYITHSEVNDEQGAGKKDCIEMGANQGYATDTLPTDPNLAYGTVDSIEVDANPAYGTNTVPTDPNVAYGTHPPQMNDYDYIGLL